MITMEQFSNGEVELTDEWFSPICKPTLDSFGVPYNKVVAFFGMQTGTLLHPDFGDILEHGYPPAHCDTDGDFREKGVEK